MQGEFNTGVGKTFKYTNSAGITTILNYSAGGNVWLTGTPDTVTDGNHIKINQKNHGMHATTNVVTLDKVQSDIPIVKLTQDYDNSAQSITIEDATNFTEFEGVGVGSTNLGYAKIGAEIISYSGVNNNTLTGVTRGVDSTIAASHEISHGEVEKYELNGVSLRRINTNHNLTNATVTDPVSYTHLTLPTKA